MFKNKRELLAAFCLTAVLVGCGQDEVVKPASGYVDIQGDHVVEDKSRWLTDSRPEKNGFVVDAKGMHSDEIGMGRTTVRVDFLMERAGSRVALVLGCRNDRTGGVELQLDWTQQGELFASLIDQKNEGRTVDNRAAVILSGADAQGATASLYVDYTPAQGLWTVRDARDPSKVVATWSSPAAVGAGNRIAIVLKNAKGGIIEVKSQP